MTEHWRTRAVRHGSFGPRGRRYPAALPRRIGFRRGARGHAGPIRWCGEDGYCADGFKVFSYLFSPADSLDTAGGTGTPRDPPGRESGEGKPLPRVLSLAGDSSFGETDDHALNTYRKYCGFYFIYYFETSKLKGRDSLIPRDSLLENTGDGSREYHLRPEPFSFNLHERPRFPAAGGTERPETVRRTVFNGGRAAALDGSRSAVE